MQVLAYLFSLLLGALGFIFLVASAQTNFLPRLIIGLVLLGAAVMVVALTRLRPRQETIVQKIDLSGDVSTEELKCKSCGAVVEKESVTVKAGAVFVECGHCGTSYQLEEAPKW